MTRNPLAAALAGASPGARNLFDLDAALAEAKKSLAQAEGQEAWWHDRVAGCRAVAAALEQLLAERAGGAADALALAAIAEHVGAVAAAGALGRMFTPEGGAGA